MLHEIVTGDVFEIEPATVAPERLEGRDELDGESWSEVWEEHQGQ